MKTSQQNVFKKERSSKTRIACLLFPHFYLLFLMGCWYTAISRYFNDETNIGSIGEWKFSVSVSAFFSANKKTFVKDYGRSPDEFYDYKVHVTFWTVAKIDSALSVEERRDVRIDSLKIGFGKFFETFRNHNTFEENQKRREDAYIEVNFGSIYISPGTQHVDITVYGMSRSIKAGLEPFKLSTRLHYKEMSERISKYD